MIFFKCKKPVPRGYVLYNAIMWHPGRDKTIGMENKSVIARFWRMGLTINGKHKRVFGSDEAF